MERIESLFLGQTKCDFMRLPDFLALAESWLEKDKLHHVVTLNPEMVMLAERDRKFAAAVAGADLRVPDGAGLIWARWYIRSQFWSLWPSLLAFPFVSAERVTGVELVIKLAKLCAKKNMGLGLVGGTGHQIDKTATVLRRKFPSLKIVTAKPHRYDINGPEHVLQTIRDNRPAVLLVAYGAPKQTVWLENNRNALSGVRVAVGVGGAFAIIGEEKPRAPYIFRRLNAEWLWRLVLEPARLPRIWRATVLFPLLINKQKQKSSEAI
ncbi:MAG: WecB/TagA/CpsF family glycosyltransferase [Candidatus Andersenbacteria bacterium]|nr:WecB/TagA/CpsF family glycosyltransferase [bacterium]MDZ4225539.1 WecB/TagA/CpsF family glycosyltransferase [Candidatus Andersenbacteria bacterium]